MKFVQMIHLSAIRRLVDIIDQEDCDSSLMSTTSGATNSFMFQTNQNLVAFVCLEDLRERCYTFQLVVDSPEDKWSFLRTVCRHVSNTSCRSDPDQLLVRLFNNINIIIFYNIFTSKGETLSQRYEPGRQRPQCLQLQPSALIIPQD